MSVHAVRGRRVAEVVSVGNELLIGHTLDTNSFWIGKQLAKFGWSLERVTQLRDSLSAIKGGVLEALTRKPPLLFTIGGLGPTHDDMTLRGLAVALNVPLELNDEALRYVTERYSRLNKAPLMTSFRRKMAMLPKGSTPLPNPVGTAPGVLTKVSGTKIISMPGVPAEMKSIFRESVAPLLRVSKGERAVEARVRIVGVFESSLAPILARARRKFPGLYFKSHPKGRETGVRSSIELHVYTIKGGNGETIRDALVFVVSELRKISVNDNAMRVTGVFHL